MKQIILNVVDVIHFVAATCVAAVLFIAYISMLVLVNIRRLAQ